MSATPPNQSLFVVEGDSAKASQARDVEAAKRLAQEEK
jgi:hypothetical protein